MMEGLLFGIVDNGVLIFGAYTGLDIGERLAQGRGALGAVLGAGIGNAVSDAAGAATDPAMHGMIAGVTVGCLIALAVVPVIEWIKRSK
tara:strand:+ start:1587 stop:1853 length:267 start_codon:yes stop_codon:yes gene_type:complete